MLYSYSKKPVYERERIIYHQNLALLDSACSSGKEVTFTYRDKPGILHRVVPYKVKYGTDELHNYLLCQEYNEFRGEMIAMSYRLCRIVSPRITGKEGKLDKRAKDCLIKMEECGPQYTINEEIETCVEFTPNGRKSFQRLYQGRPVVGRRDPEDDRGNVKYYFTCSQDQLYLYLRQFNPGETTILYPERLRERLYQFHLFIGENIRNMSALRLLLLLLLFRLCTVVFLLFVSSRLYSQSITPYSACHSPPLISSTRLSIIPFGNINVINL